jgi:hypothetical protein
VSWLAFSSSFSPAGPSTARVATWRRLKRLGAVSLRPGLWVLPETDDLLEAVTWLAQEARHGDGEAVVMRVAAFEGLPDSELERLFRDCREQDYSRLEERLGDLRRSTGSTERSPDSFVIRGQLSRLRSEFDDIVRIDYFEAPGRGRLLRQFAAFQRELEGEPARPSVPPRDSADYVGRRWRTRAKPFVDRLACAWLIRRFIDRGAEISYGGESREGDVLFDVPGGDFDHTGNLCTFEVMLEAFSISLPGIRSIAAVVHAIDLQDGLYAPGEAPGIEAVLGAWRDSLDDESLEDAALTLFDGLLHFYGTNAKETEDA